mgnify:CR=1 FL=1
MHVDFFLGETRHVRIRIYSCHDDPFKIASAKYSLCIKGSAEEEDGGASVIQEHVIDQVITPKRRGTYSLQITYRIADETLIEDVEVRVY